MIRWVLLFLLSFGYLTMAFSSLLSTDTKQESTGSTSIETLSYHQIAIRAKDLTPKSLFSFFIELWSEKETEDSESKIGLFLFFALIASLLFGIHHWSRVEPVHFSTIPLRKLRPQVPSFILFRNFRD